jgi:lysyl-tRNA synthetase class II
MMEVYEAFGDYETMRELTESLIHELALLSRDAQRSGAEAQLNSAKTQACLRCRLVIWRLITRDRLRA